MSRRLVWVVAVALTVLGVVITVVGCGGGGDAVGGGTGPANATLGVAATGATIRPSGGVGPADVAEPPVLVINLAGGGTVEIDQAYVGISRVDLVPVAQEPEPEPEAIRPQCSGGSDFGGPYVADIVQRKLLNPDGSVALDLGAEYPAGIALEHAEVACGPVAGVCPANPDNPATIHVHGTYRDAQGAAVYSFHLDSNAEAILEFEADDLEGIIVGDDDVFQVVFVLNQWFSGVDLDTANTALTDGNGDVLLNDDNNAALQAAIAANILQHTGMGEDTDGDGDPDNQF